MCLGIPGQIVAIDDAEKKLATVNVSGVRRQVNIACIVDETHPVDACVGEAVLSHFARQPLFVETWLALQNQI